MFDVAFFYLSEPAAGGGDNTVNYHRTAVVDVGDTAILRHSIELKGDFLIELEFGETSDNRIIFVASYSVLAIEDYLVNRRCFKSAHR